MLRGLGVTMALPWLESLPVWGDEPAKNKKSTTKADAIRELLGQNPKMPVKDIIAALGARGIDVKSNLVYLLRSKMRSKSRKLKRRQAVQAGRDAGMANPVALVLKVRQLAFEAGGIKHLKQLVDVLSE